jgi:uncharacterized protein YdcH (DUF465 family)
LNQDSRISIKNNNSSPGEEMRLNSLTQQKILMLNDQIEALLGKINILEQIKGE